MEISFRHVLPNFWECWWDHVSIVQVAAAASALSGLAVETKTELAHIAAAAAG